MKIKLILSMLIPLMNMSVTILRDKDDNSTGLDDAAANQIEAAIKSIQEYANS
jgi:hypothetical protein